MLAHDKIDYTDTCPVTGEKIKAYFDDIVYGCLVFEFGSDILIQYGIYDDRDDVFSPMEGKYGEFCRLHFIQNETGTMGEGTGSKALKSFFAFAVRELKVDEIYSFANYDESYYTDEDDNIEISTEDGIGRLVRFYEKAGFNITGGYSYNSDQVDMQIYLDPEGSPKIWEEPENIPSMLSASATPENKLKENPSP